MTSAELTFPSSQYITAHRVNPVTHKGYLLVSRTAFSKGASKARAPSDLLSLVSACSMADLASSSVAPIRLDGTSVKFIAGAIPTVNSTTPRDTDTLLRGLDAKIETPEPVVPSTKTDSNGISYSEIVVPENFPPGSVLVFATWMDDLKPDVDEFCASGAEEAFKELDLVDLNSAIYRADGEERDAGEWRPSSSLSAVADFSH